MGPAAQDVLDRFHQILAREVYSRSSKNPNDPVMVSDICYDLVPFETRRDELGIMTVFEYERALLQLLSGQGGYAEMEYMGDRQRIQRHLDSRNPDSGLYREFLSSAVRIRPLADEPSSAEDTEENPQHFERCPSCRQNLPPKEIVRFCPQCGTNVQWIPCLSCGERLSLDWHFCVVCGTGVAPAVKH